MLHHTAHDASGLFDVFIGVAVFAGTGVDDPLAVAVHRRIGSIAGSRQVVGLAAVTAEDNIGSADGQLVGIDVVFLVDEGHGGAAPAAGVFLGLAGGGGPGIDVDAAPVGGGVVEVNGVGSGSALAQAAGAGAVYEAVADGLAAGITHAADVVGSMAAVGGLLVVNRLLMDQIAQHQNGGGDAFSISATS